MNHLEKVFLIMTRPEANCLESETLRRSKRRRAFLLLLLLVVSAFALADTIFLKNGGKIHTGNWWYEGSELRYTGYGGTYGIPASEVSRIVKDDIISSREVNHNQETKSPSADPGSFQKEIEELDRRAQNLHLIARTVSDNGEVRLQIAEIFTKIGNRFFDNKNYEMAISYYSRAIAQDSGFLPPKINMASSLMMTGDYRQAQSYIHEAMLEHPDNPLLHDILGEIRYMMDDIQEAISEWERAIQIEPNEKISKKIDRARKELILSERYHKSNGSHFTLMFDGEKHSHIGDDIIAFLEESYNDLALRFSHYPQMTISVILYPETAFYDITESPKWVGGLFDGKIRIPVGGLDTLTRRAKQMLLHELAHAFIYSRTNGNCPRWLHEGIAQIIEGKGAPLFKTIKEKIGETDFDSLSENLDYPLSLSFTSFIEKRYSFHAILLILDELGRGTDIGNALAQVTGVSADDLIVAWKEFLSSKGE
ncbi:MAG: tetratricopeptide repeat protein [Acidobacteriota bacterium]